MQKVELVRSASCLRSCDSFPIYLQPWKNGFDDGFFFLYQTRFLGGKGGFVRGKRTHNATLLKFDSTPRALEEDAHVHRTFQNVRNGRLGEGATVERAQQAVGLDCLRDLLLKLPPLLLQPQHVYSKETVLQKNV